MAIQPTEREQHREKTTTNEGEPRGKLGPTPAVQQDRRGTRERGTGKEDGRRFTGNTASTRTEDKEAPQVTEEYQDLQEYQSSLFCMRTQCDTMADRRSSLRKSASAWRPKLPQGRGGTCVPTPEILSSVSFFLLLEPL